MEEERHVSVVIYVHPEAKERPEVLEITYGMEEEGIPYVLKSHREEDLMTLARLATMESRLDVGIGVNKALSAGICYDKLPEEMLLFPENLLREGTRARTLGKNAARLVKGIPFEIGGDAT